MIFGIFIVIIASILLAFTTHIDKYMVSGNLKFSTINTLMVFYTLAVNLISLPIYSIIYDFNFLISPISLISIFGASLCVVIGTYLYYKCISIEEISIVSTLFQFTPVLTFTLSIIFFKEYLSINQIIGSLFIIGSAALISYDSNSGKLKWKPIIYCLISCFFTALYYILFDLGIRNSAFEACFLYYQIGMIIIGLFLICFPKIRNDFITAIKLNGKKYISLNLINEFTNLSATMLVNYANVFLPIALVNTLNGLQSAFVFILALIGIKLLPKYFNEDISKSIIIRKITSIILSMIGLIIIFMN